MNPLLISNGVKSVLKKKRSDEMKKLMKLPISSIILICLIAGVGVYGAYQIFYTLTVPANISITTNTYKIKLWNLDETEEITAILFPSTMEGSDIPSITSEFWVKMVNTDPIYVTWRAENVPIGFILLCYHADGEWVSGETMLMQETSGYKILTHFVLDVGNVIEGSYNFDIIFESGEVTS